MHQTRACGWVVDYDEDATCEEVQAEVDIARPGYEPDWSSQIRLASGYRAPLVPAE